MAYIEGTITGGYSYDFHNSVVQPALLSAGFVFIESVMVYDSVPAFIYKSPGTLNSFGSDWYLIIHTNSTTSNLISFIACEYWDTVEKKQVRWMPSGVNIPQPDSTDKSVGTAKQLAVSGYAFGDNYYYAYTGSTYYMNFTVDRLIMYMGDMTNNTASDNKTGYLGLYDPVVPCNFPLTSVILNKPYSLVQGTTPYLGALTREHVASPASYTTELFHVSMVGSQGTSQYNNVMWNSFGNYCGGNDSLTYVNKVTQSLKVLSIALLTQTAVNSDGKGGAIGALKDVRTSMHGANSVSGGDTLAVTLPDNSIANYVRGTSFHASYPPIWIPKQ